MEPSRASRRDSSEVQFLARVFAGLFVGLLALCIISPLILITFRKTDQDCGGTFRASNGTLQSPGYPANYPGGLTCVYVIQRPDGERITLTFEQFDLEWGDISCTMDYVEIRDGDSSSSPLIRRACGSTAPSATRSSGNSMRIRFKSDDLVGGVGFRASYVSGDYTAEPCGGRFTESTGTLQSPDYPASYPGNKDCVYVIRRPDDERITLTFEQFDLEWGGVSCNYDYVEVRDGGFSNSPRIVRACGNSTPSAITSSRNSMRIRFKSDEAVSGDGFRASYSSGSVGSTTGPTTKRIATTTTQTIVTTTPSSSLVVISGPDPFTTDGSESMTLTCDPKNKHDHVTGVTWHGVTCTKRKDRDCVWTPHAPEDDGKVVTCSVTYSDGLSVNATFVVNLNYPPQKPPEIHGYTGDTRQAGGGLTMTCVVHDGKPLVTSVDFACDGHPDTPDIRGVSFVQSLLSIKPLTAEHNGLRCTCTADWNRTEMYKLSAVRRLKVEGDVPETPGASNSDTGVIVGSVISGVLGLIGLIGGIFWYRRKRARAREAPDADSPTPVQEEGMASGQRGFQDNPDDEDQGARGPMAAWGDVQLKVHRPAERGVYSTIHYDQADSDELHQRPLPPQPVVGPYDTLQGAEPGHGYQGLQPDAQL